MKCMYVLQEQLGRHTGLVVALLSYFFPSVVVPLAESYTEEPRQPEDKKSSNAKLVKSPVQV